MTREKSHICPALCSINVLTYIIACFRVFCQGEAGKTNFAFFGALGILRA